MVAATVDEYIEGFPLKIQKILRAVRTTVRAAAPQAEERISYGIPAIFQKGVVVYFAAFKSHIGLYPPVKDRAVRARVADYAGPKGNLQFSYSAPIPLNLVSAVVKARLKTNLGKSAPRTRRTKTVRAAAHRPKINAH